MRLLVLGGTAWVGAEVARQALGAGHEVVCAARGASGGTPEGVALAVVDRDDPHGLDRLAADHWDAVVDVTRRPDHARSAAAALRGAVAHYVLVSTISVYGGPGTDESTPLLDPLDAEVVDLADVTARYGEAKVACEHAVVSAFGLDRSALVRPGLIAGPGDHTDRTGYWPWRFAALADGSGAVLVPDAAEDACQVIDVRDLATWLVTVAVERQAGAFDAVGPTTTFGAHLETAREAAGHRGPLVAVTPDWLAAHEVTAWSGPRSLPIWVGDHAEAAGLLARTAARARAAGLAPRPLAATLADTLAWERTRAQPSPRRAGLADEAERDLLDLLLR